MKCSALVVVLFVFGPFGGPVATVQAGNDTPVGSIVAWHKSFANTPALPDNWVQCNGQTLDDPDSPYDGATLPNLNGDGRFLRGSLVDSGINQEATDVAVVTATNTGLLFFNHLIGR